MRDEHPLPPIPRLPNESKNIDREFDFDVRLSEHGLIAEEDSEFIAEVNVNTLTLKGEPRMLHLSVTDWRSVGITTKFIPSNDVISGSVAVLLIRIPATAAKPGVYVFTVTGDLKGTWDLGAKERSLCTFSEDMVTVHVEPRKKGEKKEKRDEGQQHEENMGQASEELKSTGESGDEENVEQAMEEDKIPRGLDIDWHYIAKWTVVTLTLGVIAGAGILFVFNPGLFSNVSNTYPYDGTYYCTVTISSGLGRSSGSSSFTVDHNYVSDSSGAFTGTIGSNGYFTGTDNYIGGSSSAVIYVSGTFLTLGAFTLSGSGGGATLTMVAHRTS